MAERRSPLALVVLALLAERPMHPYLMFQLINQRGKTAIVNISQRNSLYQVIDRLVRDGLAEVDTTERAANRPERTVYRITTLGEDTIKRWVLEMISAEKQEYPAFPAALSLLALVPPAEARRALAERRNTLVERQDAASASLAETNLMGLPRLFLLDDEYAIAMRTAEIAWLDGVLEQLATGELDWSAEWIAEIAAQFEPPAT